MCLRSICVLFYNTNVYYRLVHQDTVYLLDQNEVFIIQTLTNMLRNVFRKKFNIKDMKDICSCFKYTLNLVENKTSYIILYLK